MTKVILSSSRNDFGMEVKGGTLLRTGVVTADMPHCAEGALPGNNDDLDSTVTVEQCHCQYVSEEGTQSDLDSAYDGNAENVNVDSGKSTSTLCVVDENEPLVFERPSTGSTLATGSFSPRYAADVIRRHRRSWSVSVPSQSCHRWWLVTVG